MCTRLFHRTLILVLILAASLLIIPAASLQDTAAVEELVPEVVSVRPHEPSAFTQGLILYDGLLYESTGRYGQSSLRQVDPETGEVLLYLPIPEQFFAEGLALADGGLYQITWREQTAFRFNLSAFTEHAPLEVRTFPYVGEGWGLCYDDEFLWMSDGSDILTLRDPETFDSVETRQVTLEGVPLGQQTSTGEPIITPAPAAPGATPEAVIYSGQRLDRLNELECVGDSIYANVWQTDTILRIDKATGAVTAEIDATGLLPEEDRPGADVLNGIVYLPETDTFLLTGKLWPKMFEVQFVPAESKVTG
ncbi:MAG: glutaminyl-peptide cyclotransferase [Anaerolineae bacterium]|nr:glutaminyl-peptide cyclotransferase [Anaerolineae bacterium]